VELAGGSMNHNRTIVLLGGVEDGASVERIA
jgi:hypothetical protein